MTLFGHYVLGLDFWIAVLLGAVTSPTDAAAVFSVLRDVAHSPSAAGRAGGRVGLDDAPTVLLVTLASSIAVGHEPDGGGVLGLAGLIVVGLLAGLAIGIGLGWVGVWLLRRVALPSSGLYPLAALVWAVFAYSAAAMLHTSGFAAVYACALISRQHTRLPHRTATRCRSSRGHRLDRPDRAPSSCWGCWLPPGRVGPFQVGARPHLSAGFFLTFVARPLSSAAFLCRRVFEIPSRKQTPSSPGPGFAEQSRLCWRPSPRCRRRSGGGRVSCSTWYFVFVVIFTSLQAPTLPFVARRTGGLLGEDSAGRWRSRRRR